MIRLLAKQAIALVALLGVVTAGWGCGLTLADSMPGGQNSTASVDPAQAMPDNPMKDCQGTDKTQGNVTPPCFALCASTVTVVPAISRAVAVQIGEPLYPAAPSIQTWLIQPEPYPPRA